MNTVKRTIAVVLILTVLVCHLSVDCLAGDAKDHRKDLLQVLFGRSFSEKQFTDDQKNLFTAIFYASYLALDQTKDNGEEKLLFLRQNTLVLGLPDQISEFSVPGGSGHRIFTHRGWDHDYSEDQDLPKSVDANDIQNRWLIRKSILLSTINKVFPFGPLSNRFLGFDEKCQAFSALVYYVHILGDQIQSSDIDESQKNFDVVNYNVAKGISSCLKTLFEDQKLSWSYISLQFELSALEDSINELNNYYSPDGVNWDMFYKEYNSYAQEILDLLIAYVPTLLRNESFFTDVFVK